MSRFITKQVDGTYLEEIESMYVCKWKINEVCCNDSSEYCGDYPHPEECCDKWHCDYYEKEDGIIKDNDEGD